MKRTLLCVALFVLLEQSIVRSQTQCVEQICTQKHGRSFLNAPQAYAFVQEYFPDNNKPAYERYGNSSKVKRDTGYYDEQQYQVFDHGKVIIIPPLGKAPKNVPQPGSPGGGARPEDNPYIAAMAPENTVPVAIFPSFDNSPDSLSKCVIFSQLTDFEEADFIDHESIQENVAYELVYSPPSIDRVANEARQKRQLNTKSLFGPRNPRNAQSQTTSSTLSFGPPSYSPPSYAPPTEPPVRVIYRKFGFVCEFIASYDCVLSQIEQSQPNLQYGQPQQYGQYVQHGNYEQAQQTPQIGNSTVEFCNEGKIILNGNNSPQISKPLPTNTPRANSQGTKCNSNMKKCP